MYTDLTVYRYLSMLGKSVFFIYSFFFAWPHRSCSIFITLSPLISPLKRKKKDSHKTDLCIWICLNEVRHELFVCWMCNSLNMQKTLFRFDSFLAFYLKLI